MTGIAKRSLPIFGRLLSTTIFWATLFVVLMCSEQTYAQTDEQSAEATQTPLAPSSLPQQVTSSLDKDFIVYNEARLSGRIAFSLSMEGREKILALDLDALKVRRIVDGPGNNSYPSWSPDGTHIAFTSDRDGNKEIYVASWNGEKPQRLTNNSVEDDNPSWSPDGKKIVYYSTTGKESNSPETNLFSIATAPGSAPTRLTNVKGKNSTPRWSPNGEMIAFSTNRYWPGWDICLLDLKTKHESCPLSGMTTYCRPAWSNDSGQLLYSGGIANQIDLGVLDIKAKTTKTLTHLEGRSYDAVYDAKERYIAFVSEKDKKEVFNLYVLDTSDGKVSPLLTSLYSLRFLSWTPARTMDLEVMRIKQQETVPEKEQKNTR